MKRTLIALLIVIGFTVGSSLADPVVIDFTGADPFNPTGVPVGVTLTITGGVANPGNGIDVVNDAVLFNFNPSQHIGYIALQEIIGGTLVFVNVELDGTLVFSGNSSGNVAIDQNASDISVTSFTGGGVRVTEIGLYAAAVPEPSALMLLGAGLLGLGILKRRLG